MPKKKREQTLPGDKRPSPIVKERDPEKKQPRSPPQHRHRHRRRHSPSPVHSDEDDFCSPLSKEIRRVCLPRGMEKPSALDSYDGTTDPDEHIAVMEYHVVRGSIKCRIFSMTLTKGTMTWYRNLSANSIHSWAELKSLFYNHFRASRRHLKFEASLEAIVQGADEPLRAYLDKFNREAIQVKMTDQMKRYLLDRGLNLDTDFKKAIGIEKVHSIDALLLKAQTFIAYKEKEAATKRGLKSQDTPRSSGYDNPPRRGGEKIKDDRSWEVKDQRGPSGRFTEYTPLNASH
ncbi:uncharacterized protein LOC131632859 [Vicia villosa]|uniref:uncharacterized protein LOC131632859 n=1 Tax=Vicia villosa TaxID=3911 RepID=UPI00273ACE36|nr:uncharacterized protein LOC131632859 [Vicia villosa]